ncbi:ATP-binding protein [Pseudonocardia sp. RS11V-5]|uniref:ATP-binding SpoIIE family protein phosphatase n=1 Tax=Pseudonocardia terrae TaxID=2905831 RepID=UPI001E38697A|nr:ATP-binding SpoIIE family protein phosphatase [Pseudonocardia terrae]MCE3554690.1 ATP-binding protein [Pseudonocardia terrae]
MDPVIPPRVEDVAWLPLDDPSGPGGARRAAEKLADQLGFPAQRVAEVGLAVTEIGTNVLRHAGGGAVLLRAVHLDKTGGVEVVAVDAGPGMSDVPASSRDGHSTRGTLGVGLGAIGRLADALDIGSRPGKGTVLVARFRPGRDAGPPGPDAAGVTRPLSGEQLCGDAYALREEGSRLWLMLCDGAGHGPLAAAASREAVRAFAEPERPPSTPVDALRAIHGAMSGTRGGAVAVAELDPDAGLVRFAGVGNVAGAVVSGTSKRSMISVGGIAGYRVPTLRAYDYPLPPDAVVVLHSDGVRPRWQAEDLALPRRSPVVVAAALLRDEGVRQDDASVVVGRAPGAGR